MYIVLSAVLLLVLHHGHSGMMQVQWIYLKEQLFVYYNKL